MNHKYNKNKQPITSKKWGMSVLFIAMLGVYFVQFAYGLIVREPYPSMMMPGFSRIDNLGDSFVFFDKTISVVSQKQDTIEIGIKELSNSYSKIAMNRVLTTAFFSSKRSSTFHSKRARYYEIIRSILGDKIYQKHVVEKRNKTMSAAEVEVFKVWIRKRVELLLQETADHIIVKQWKMIKHNKTGEILEKQLIAKYTL